MCRQPVVTGVVLLFATVSIFGEPPPKNDSHALTRWVVNSGDDANPEAAGANLRLRQVSVAEPGVEEGVASNGDFCLSLGLLAPVPQCGQECDKIRSHQLKYFPRQDRVIAKVFLKVGSGAGWTVTFELTGPAGLEFTQTGSGLTGGKGKVRVKFPPRDGPGTYTCAVVRIQNPRGEDICVGYFEPRQVDVPPSP